VAVGLDDDESAALWVAEREGEIVGSVGMTDQGDGIARLRWFIVAPQARRSGVGGRLLEHALGWARDEGLDTVVLYTIGTLVDAARLYRRAGFLMVSERVGTEWSDTITEQRWELALRD